MLGAFRMGLATAWRDNSRMATGFIGNGEMVLLVDGFELDGLLNPNNASTRKAVSRRTRPRRSDPVSTHDHQRRLGASERCDHRRRDPDGDDLRPWEHGDHL